MSTNPDEVTVEQIIDAMQEDFRELLSYTDHAICDIGYALLRGHGRVVATECEPKCLKAAIGNEQVATWLETHDRPELADRLRRRVRELMTFAGKADGKPGEERPFPASGERGDAAMSLRNNSESFANFLRALRTRITGEPLVSRSVDPGITSAFDSLADGFFTSKSLAERYGIDPERLRKRLDRWRKSNLDVAGWREVEDRRPREPKYLYRESAVKPILDELQAICS